MKYANAIFHRLKTSSTQTSDAIAEFITAALMSKNDRDT